VHHSEKAFRAHATGPQVKRRAGLTGSCCRGAGHKEGEKEGSKRLPAQGRNSLSACCRFCPGTAYIVSASARNQVAISGNQWQSVCGNQWHSATLRGKQWQSVSGRRSAFSRRTCSGNQWQSVTISGHPCQSVLPECCSAFGRLSVRRQSVAIGGNQWHSAAISDNQCQIAAPPSATTT
jgi:hypothetical protein